MSHIVGDLLSLRQDASDISPILSISIATVLFAMCFSVLLARFVPGLGQLLKYGKVGHGSSGENLSQSHNKLGYLVSILPISWKVPKRWFTYFYLLSSSLSTINLYICLLLIEESTTFQGGSISQSYLSLRNIPVSLILLLIHGIRRSKEMIAEIKQKPLQLSSAKPLAIPNSQLYDLLSAKRESTTQSHDISANQSKIQLAHFIAGIIFYTCVNTVQFIGVIDTFLPEKLQATQLESYFSAKVVLGIVLFAIGSYVQQISHLHLSSLIKYSLPTYPSPISTRGSPKYRPRANFIVSPERLFGVVACPHYTAEILIYIGFALTSPSNVGITSIVQIAMISWVVINLAVSAEQTRKWYIKEAQVGRFEKLGNSREKGCGLEIEVALKEEEMMLEPKTWSQVLKNENILLRRKLQDDYRKIWGEAKNSRIVHVPKYCLLPAVI